MGSCEKNAYNLLKYVLPLSQIVSIVQNYAYVEEQIKEIVPLSIDVRSEFQKENMQAEVYRF